MPVLTLAGPEQEKLIEAVTDLVTTGVVPVAQFVAAYNLHRSIARQTPRFAVLDVEHGGELQAVPPALHRAIDDDFFVALCSALFERLSRPLPETDTRLDAFRSILGAVPAVGVMQTILRVAGVRPVSSLPALLRAARATALITTKVPGTNETVFGTGFLVSPTLMLTAAHVVEALIDNAAARPGSAELATVQFHNQLEGQGDWPIIGRLASQWLVCMSPPNGVHGMLASTTAAEAAKHLDFALIRLSEPVGNVTGVVDVLNPPIPEVSGRLTVIGYAGGTECVFDDHVVQKHEADARRIHHDVNTAAGMSGGPCIDTRGNAVGLHEGSVTSANPIFNRAVYLGAVRETMRLNGDDPLLVNAGPLWGIHDREARLAWIAAGDVLLGRSDAQRAEWRASVAHFNPEDQRGGASMDLFHPVFGRTDLQRWIDGALLLDAPGRIALISGGPGFGKSFSAAIVRHSLENTAHQLIVVPPTVAKGRIADVLAFILNQVGGQQPGQDPILRPTAGVVRRDLLPDTFAQLAAIVRTASRPHALLWLVADLDDDTTLTADTTQGWQQLLIEAEKHSWVRLVVLGLGTASRGQFRAAAAKPTDVDSRALSPVTSDDFIASITAQADALHLQTDHWVQESSVLWDEVVEPLTPAQGRTVVAVRAALEIRALMLQEAKAGHGE